MDVNENTYTIGDEVIFLTRRLHDFVKMRNCFLTEDEIRVRRHYHREHSKKTNEAKALYQKNYYHANEEYRKNKISATMDKQRSKLNNLETIKE